MVRVNKIYSAFIMSLLVLLPSVLAQSEVFSKGLLRSILGPLPQACSFSLGSADCIACLSTAKLLPFTFFFGLIYFVMVFLVFRILGGIPSKELGLDIKKVTPSFYYASILVSIAFALIMLHVREVSSLFINIGQLQNILFLGFSIIVVVTFLHTLQGFSNMLNLFILLFSIGIVWTLYNTLVVGGVVALPIPDIVQSPCFLAE